MRRLFLRLLLIAMLLVAVGTMILPSQAQVGGPPPGIIVKPPGESELNVAVWMGPSPLFLIGSPAQDFIHFALNQEACVYLLDIAPNEEREARDVKLLLSRCLEPGTHDFPENFKGFQVPGPEGTHLVQAIATLFPIDLGPEGQVLGTDPELVRAGIEVLIQEQGLGTAGWAADWTQYEAVFTMPFTLPKYGSFLVKVVEVADGKEFNIKDAQVAVVPSGQPITLKHFESLTQGKEFKKELGEYTLRARARLHVPDPLENLEQPQPCEVKVERPTGWKWTEIPDCQWQLINEEETREIKFTLHFMEQKAAYFYLEDNPYCAGEEVRFDASKSGPRDEISEYYWEFGDDISRRITNPEKTGISHTFRKEGEYRVRLTVYYTDGDSRSYTETVSVLRPGDPRCYDSRPPEPIPRIERVPDDPDLVDCRIRDGTVIESVYNGYCIVRITLPLPQDGSSVKLDFKYKFTSFPNEDVQRGILRASSDVRLIFVGEGGIPLLPQPQKRPFETVSDGEAVTTSIEHSYSSYPIPIPSNAQGLQVWVTTSVQAGYGASGVPVSVEYWDFQPTAQSPPCPEARVIMGQLEDGQFVSKGTPAIYSVWDTIAFQFFNGCGQPITLANSAPWVIQKSSGKVVFTPERESVAVQIPPQGTLTWTVKPERFVEQTEACGASYKVVLVTQEGISYPSDDFILVWRSWRC